MKVAFYVGGGSTVDKLIQWWTADLKDKFNGAWHTVPSHVEVSLGDEVWWSVSARTGIFRNKVMHLNEVDWRVYDFHITEAERHDMIMAAISFLGYKYDWLNILGSDILKLNIGAKKRLTCDEGAARILKHCWVGKKLDKINNLNPKRLEDYISKFTLK